MAEQVNPMDLLREEMDNDEIALRVNAIHRIKIICTLLGPDGIKSQLLPFLESKSLSFQFRNNIKTYSVQWQISHRLTRINQIRRRWSSLRNCRGNGHNCVRFPGILQLLDSNWLFRTFIPHQVAMLIPYLENLASVEETVVREAALKSLSLVATNMQDNEISNTFAPMVSFLRMWPML